MIGITVIVWRKMSFLRKLTPEAHEMGDTWLHDMAPETIDWLRGIHWRQYTRSLLIEFEKVLRQGRILMSAVDRASDRLVRKVRRVHEETTRQVEEHKAQIEAAKEEEEQDLEAIDLDDPEQLKLREQSLIVAIAQNPKDAVLYSDLARVYVKLGNFADAIESLQTAAKLDPEDQILVRRLEAIKRRMASQQAAI
jgi:tetratricopeptide (TPR) repeat protein